MPIARGLTGGYSRWSCGEHNKRGNCVGKRRKRRWVALSEFIISSGFSKDHGSPVVKVVTKNKKINLVMLSDDVLRLGATLCEVSEAARAESAMMQFMRSNFGLDAVEMQRLKESLQKFRQANLGEESSLGSTTLEKLHDSDFVVTHRLTTGTPSTIVHLRIAAVDCEAKMSPKTAIRLAYRLIYEAEAAKITSFLSSFLKNETKLNVDEQEMVLEGFAVWRFRQEIQRRID